MLHAPGAGRLFSFYNGYFSTKAAKTDKFSGKLAFFAAFRYDGSKKNLDIGPFLFLHILASVNKGIDACERD